MRFVEYALTKFNKVNNYYNENPDDLEKGLNAIKLKIKYNIDVDKSLYDKLGNKLYNILDENLSNMYSGISNTFYRDFPEGIPDDDILVLINQINHYITGDMHPIFENKVVNNYNLYDIDKKIKATPVRTISLSNNLYLEILNNFLGYESNISETDYKFLEMIVKYKVDISTLDKKIIKNRTLAMHLIHALLEKRNYFNVQQMYPYIKTVNDVMKYVDICTYKKYSYIKTVNDVMEYVDICTYKKYYNDEELHALSSYDYNCIFSMFAHVLENQKLENAFSDIKLNEGKIKKLLYLSNGYISKGNKEIYNTLKNLVFNTKLKSVNSLVDDMIDKGEYDKLAYNYPSLFIRKYTVISSRKDFKLGEISEKSYKKLLELPTRMIIQLFNRLVRDKDIPTVYDTAKGFVVKDKPYKHIKLSNLIYMLLNEKLKPLLKQGINEVYNILLDEYKKSAESNETFKEYCSKFDDFPKIYYSVPTSSKDISSLKSIPYSRFKLPKSSYISLYTKWKEDTDIDLSAKLISENSSVDCAYYTQRVKINNDTIATHSGDITRNPDTSKYVSERIIIDKDKALKNGIKYIFVNDFSYQGKPLNESDVHIGIQAVDKFESLNENLEDTYFDTVPDTDRTSFSFLLIDLENNEVVIVNKSLNTINFGVNAIDNSYLKVADFVNSISKTNINLNNISNYIPDLTDEELNILSLSCCSPDLSKVILDKFK